MSFEAASVTVAMFCLIQFYIQLRQDLAEHRPFLKVLCIKLVIFFSFWQSVSDYPTSVCKVAPQANARQLVISFLSSSSGPLQPTAKMAYPDIYVGIPSVLLCIEMAIFSIMHLFAFPWKPYSIKHSHKDPITASGSGYSGESPRYKGGPFGILAFADAFNPWDIIKASARGFRWLFVGSRHRHTDSSYQKPAKVITMDGFNVPEYAGNGEPATELRSSKDMRSGSRQRGETVGTDLDVDDRAGLLRHSGQMAGRPPSTSPYRPYENVNNEYSRGDDSQLDLGASARMPTTGHARGPSAGYPALSGSDKKAGDFGPPVRYDPEEDDTGYRGASSGSGAVHPALRDENMHPGYTDHWGGARPTDADSVRPPTYRTQDPGR